MRRQQITSLPASTERDDRSVGRVLYVDDDAFAAALLRATLEDAGFEVQWTPCARSALEAAATGTYDAFLLGVVRGSDSCSGLAEKFAATDGDGRCVIVAGCAESFPLIPSVSVRTRCEQAVGIPCK